MGDKLHFGGEPLLCLTGVSQHLIYKYFQGVLHIFEIENLER